MGTILYRGKHHQVPFEVHRSADRWWRGGDIGARYRAPHERIRAVCLHWTGGTASAETTYRTLKNRRLSTTFVVDGRGEAHQFTDVQTAAYDSGKANGWSVGIEITGPGFVRPGITTDLPEYIDRIHGKRIRVWRFYPHQVGRVYDLCSALCEILGLPWQVPADEDGELLTTVMTDEEQASFAGIMGHFHVDRGKVDPGTALLRELASRASLPQS